MSPEELLAAVAARSPVDERERLAIADFTRLLPALARPYDEHADATHVTGSAIVVGARGVILHHHKRLDMWLQPGGHIDVLEDPAVAALRETVEETGLAARHPAGGPRLVHVDVHRGASGHTHLDVRFLLEAPDDDPRPAPGESQEVAWFTWDDAICMADEGLAGALRHLRPHR